MANPVLIIGGGIAGMTAALALQRAGLSVEIYEQATDVGDVGAGITLGRTASRGLYALGLRQAIVEASDVPQRAGALHYQTAKPLNNEGPGGPGGVNLQQQTDDEPPFFHQIHRADLFKILLDAVRAEDPYALRLNHEFTRFEQNADGVVAVFADGATSRGAALIGADGIRSTVRTQLFGPEAPRFTGQVVYRFLIPVARVRRHLSAGQSNLFVGPGRTVLRYIIRHGTVVNGVAFVKTEAWTEEGYSARATPEELMAQFPGWHEDVIGLFRNAPPEGTAKWALYDRDPLPFWTKGRVTLLGDAAHPMLPFLGLGAAMGIEDGVVLARVFGLHADPLRALRVYEDARIGRSSKILLASRLQGERFQSADPAKFEESSRPSTNPDLYDYDPSTAPLEPALITSLA